MVFDKSEARKKFYTKNPQHYTLKTAQYVKKGRPDNSERDARIIELHKNKKTLSQIVNELNLSISLQRVHQIIKTYANKEKNSRDGN